jgi:polysaccharide export outer membrane protein
VLSIQVYGEGEMSAKAPDPDSRDSKEEDNLRPGTGAQVRLDGRISLKHIGDIDAVGFTLTQLADHLKDLYATVFDNPIITVVLVQSNSKRYTVMGKVARPGIFYLDFPINIVQAIARSGGFTEWAKSEITLVRKEVKKDPKNFVGNKLTFDYDDFLEGKNLSRNVLLQPDDILIVH